jgi:hopene-associated glycosyltransferase HpnB
VARLWRFRSGLPHGADTLALSFIIAAASLAAWVYLLAGRGAFWRAQVLEDEGTPQPLRAWPGVAAVVPARNEAELIGTSIGGLLDLDYPGSLAVILIDDHSADATAALARTAAVQRGADRLTVLSGQALADGWTGKLWAMKQGIDRAEASAEPPRYVLFTDADIGFAPDTLTRLVARAEAEGLVLTSVMAKLRCESLAEKALIPAFVFFFQMLYPFGWVNRPDCKIAAAAGGCMLVRLDVLQRAGGLDQIRNRLIDDCALARLLKPAGPIWLGLTERVQSLRPYDTFNDVAAMVSRSAYEQLERSPLLLAGTAAGMAVTYLAPPIFALAGSGLIQGLGAAAWLLMALAFQPMLRLYRVNPGWGILLPAIACAYMVFTLHSAYQHARGRGGRWKGRTQANVSEAE